MLHTCLIKLRDSLTPNTLTVYNNTYKIITADAAYDSKELREVLKAQGGEFISAINPRNSKNPRPLNAYETNKLCNRNTVEHGFSWEKQFKQLLFISTKTQTSYFGLYLYASSYVNFNKYYIEENDKQFY